MSSADRDAVEAREDFWSMSGEFISRHHVAPREHLHAEKVIIHTSVKHFFDLTRQTKTDLDNSEENRIDDLRNIDRNRILSECWIGSTRFRILNHCPLQVHSWIDG